jgi:outer membrane immunogenic protein
MRFLLVVLTALVSACGFARTASAAPPTPLFWSGFYFGGNVGYSWGGSSSTFLFSDGASGAGLSSANADSSLNGVVGGGQMGYNWQFNNWLFGIETDFQFTGQKGSSTGICAGGASPDAAVNGACTPGHIGDTDPFNVGAFPVVSTLSQKLEWFGTLRGRFGTAITPALIAYGTGGLAYGHVETTNTISGTNIFGTNGTNTSTLVPVSVSFSDGSTRFGWVLGAGLETALGGNWSGRIEYLHIDLGTVSGSFVTPLVTNSGALLISSYSSRITDDILRVGFNYKWGG